MVSSSKTTLWTMGVLFLALEITYVVVGNSVLRSGKIENLINGNPEKLLVRFEEAKTYFPGFFLIKKVEVAGHDGSVRWRVSAKDVHAWISLSRLVSRTLLVNSVSIDEAQVEVLTRQERMPPSPPSEKAPFRLKFRDISIDKLTRLLVHDYLYTGEAKIEGDFDLWPGRLLNIWRSSIVPHGGNFFAQNSPVLTNAQGEVAVKLLNYSPRDDKDLEILDLVKRASVDLEGSVNNPRLLNLYLQNVPWLEVTKLRGALNAKFEIRDGMIAKGSKGEVKAERIDVRMGPYTSRSWGRVTWNLDKKDLFRVGLSLDDYKFYATQVKTPFMNGKKISLLADTNNLNLRETLTEVKDLGIELLIEKAKITDLTRLNDFIPVTDKFRVENGEAQLDAKLLLSTRDASKKGYFKLKTSGTRSRFRDLYFNGNADLHGDVEDLEEGIDVFRINNTQLKISDVSIINPKTSAQKKVKAWKGVFNVPEATLRPYHNAIVDGAINFAFDDAEPLLIAMHSEFRLARLLQTFTAARNLRGSALIKVGPKLVDVANFKINSSDFDVRGRYRFSDLSHKFVMWFKIDTFSAAFAFDGKKSDFTLQNTRPWYERKPSWTPVELKRVQ